MRATIFLFIISLGLLLVYSTEVLATVSDSSKLNISVFPTRDTIIIDGKLQESAWNSAARFNDFWMHYPVDTIRAGKQTEVRVTYNDEFLYIAAICHDTTARTPIIQTLSRDQEGFYWVSDAFAVVLDPTNQGKNGYFFGVTAGGAEVDALLSQTGFYPQTDNVWSNKWFSAVSKTAKGMEYEIAIPFSILRCNPENGSWGINFIRNDMETRNEYYIWTQFPINRDGKDLTSTGTMRLEKSPVCRKGRFTFIPSVSTQLKKDYEAATRVGISPGAGLDAKIAITRRLNADLMLIPDFSQANVDREYLSFEDYEYYMQEQRQFFLENSDLFTTFGSDNFKPIYTRRIGIKNWENYRIWGGARFTGTVASTIRYGMLNVQTDTFKTDPARNFTVGVYNQRFANNSEIKLLLANRESMRGSSIISTDYNRLVGVDYRFLARGGKLYGTIGSYKVFTPQNYTNSFQFGGNLSYVSSFIRTYNNINFAQAHYNNEMGYNPRMYKRDDALDTSYLQGLFEIRNKIEFWFFKPEKHRLTYLFPFIEQVGFFTPDGQRDDQTITSGMHFNHKNSAYSAFYARYGQKRVFHPLKVIDGSDLMPIGIYNGANLGLYHKTNVRRALWLETNFEYGDYYNGTRLKLFTGINYRIQPFFSLKVDYTAAKVTLPANYGNTLWHLAGIQTDVFFTRNHIWTTLVQINTQNQKFRVNSRFQWRYCPMSDFFIVVGDDLNTETGQQKQFTITAKLTYWLTI